MTDLPKVRLLCRDSLNVFAHNGFEIQDTEGKLYLKGVPYSQNISFGASDVQELAQLLHEGTSNLNQSSRISTQGSVSVSDKIPRPSRQEIFWSSLSQAILHPIVTTSCAKVKPSVFQQSQTLLLLSLKVCYFDELWMFQILLHFCVVYRVRSMLAMRACRSSIMIGKTLDMRTMRRILDHLAELDSPWNCPHGRPTMRHLAVLPQ